jgi:hypothetical protein
MLSFTRTTVRIQCPRIPTLALATSLPRRQQSLRSPRVYLAPEFSTTSRLASENRPGDPLIRWLEDKKKRTRHRIKQLDQKIEDFKEDMRKEGYSEKDIRKIDRRYRVAADIIFYATLIGIPLWLYSSWNSRGKEEEDWIKTVHKESSMEGKRSGID